MRLGGQETCLTSAPLPSTRATPAVQYCAHRSIVLPAMQLFCKATARLASIGFRFLGGMLQVGFLLTGCLPPTRAASTSGNCDFLSFAVPLKATLSLDGTEKTLVPITMRWCQWGMLTTGQAGTTTLVGIPSRCAFIHFRVWRLPVAQVTGWTTGHT